VFLALNLVENIKDLAPNGRPIGISYIAQSRRNDRPVRGELDFRRPLVRFEFHES